jgi:hypothetical protein
VVQGAIQGPGEFAEGLFLGVRSLVGHTVGGAAGAVSRITGAMGHGLAALSLDKVPPPTPLFVIYLFFILSYKISSINNTIDAQSVSKSDEKI